MSSKLIVSSIAMTLMVACSQSRMKSIETGDTVSSDQGITTQPVAGANTRSSIEHDITGYAIDDKTQVDDETKKFNESVKAIYIQTQRDFEENRTVQLRLEMTNGRVVKSKGLINADGEFQSLRYESTHSPKEDEEVETITVSQMKFSEKFKTLEITLNVDRASLEAPINPVIKAMIETKTKFDKDDIGVKSASQEVNERFHLALTRTDRVERVVAYMVGSKHPTVTYTLKNMDNLVVLSVGVKPRGTSQTPGFLYINDNYLELGRQDLKFETVSLDSNEGEVQQLIFKQNPKVGISFKLGFRSPLSAKPFNLPVQKDSVNPNEPGVEAAPIKEAASQDDDIN